MDLKVHSVHFDADKKLMDFIKAKVTKLETYFDNIVLAEVYLKLDKASDTENKVAEVRLVIPGKELFAKKQCKTFEEAADLACEAIKQQVQKHKGKKMALFL